MQIAVVGTGYVGLVAGTCFADIGHSVTCVDINPEVIDRLNQGEIPIYEPGLEEMVERNLSDGNLAFTTSLSEAMKDSLLVFLCVGTPEGESGGVNLQYVFDAAKQIGQSMTDYTIVVSKSTCPVGTAEKIRDIVAAETSQEFDIASNPEFLKEGNAVDDFLKPDRIVIGTENVRVEAILKELYRPFVRTGNPILTMDIRTAEFTKYACNTMLASRISMVNEFATIADQLGVDMSRVREGMAFDTRIGQHFLFPGLGYGGSCFPKDVVALADIAGQHGIDTHMINAIQRVNQEQRHRFVSNILAYYGGELQGKSFAVWGAAFKPKTDDLREAPALTVIDTLLDKGAAISAHDPEANEGLLKIYGDRIQIMDDIYSTLCGVDALVICTEWSKFQNPNFEKMRIAMGRKVVFDGRNIYDPLHMAELGFTYFSIGRPDVE